MAHPISPLLAAPNNNAIIATVTSNGPAIAARYQAALDQLSQNHLIEARVILEDGARRYNNPPELVLLLGYILGREGRAASLSYVDAGIDSVLSGVCAGLCTAPLSKHRVSLSHPGFQGHTEHLAERFRARTAMMMAGPRLRVTLATNHFALSDVPRELTAEKLAFVIRLTHRELAERFGMEKPRIAVCGLNPHAGDGGIFGDEEARLVSPGIAQVRAEGIDATGPHPADGLFPRAVRGDFDAVIALYHDQGLIPVKLLDFRETVNVTLGLPHPRTSPDHGTADDLAGQGKADAEPMISALLLAATLTKQP